MAARQAGRHTVRSDKGTHMRRIGRHQYGLWTLAQGQFSDLKFLASFPKKQKTHRFSVFGCGSEAAECVNFAPPAAIIMYTFSVGGSRLVWEQPASFVQEIKGNFRSAWVSDSKTLQVRQEIME